MIRLCLFIVVRFKMNLPGARYSLRTVFQSLYHVLEYSINIYWQKIPQTRKFMEQIYLRSLCWENP